MSRAAKLAICITAVISVAGCGGRGLPDAGPGPGEVDIGYDTREEEKVTGAVTTLGTDRSHNGRPLTVEELLRGKVAGLVVMKGAGGRSTFRLRGENSLISNQEPLFVVDGVPTEAAAVNTALSGLTHDDIRQIDVLKDVASTSIYGSRGAGGVILITTRR
jgi:TonB-dependent SusC/RagA subfamily outer membrane receptor